MLQHKKLHIAYIDFDDIQNPLLGAGQAVATYQLGRRLVKRGHKVTVYCSRYPGYRDRVDSGITYIHIGIGSPYIRLNNVFFLFFVPLKVLSLRNIDIIVESFVAPISTLCSPLFTSIPVIALPSMFNAYEFAKKYKLPFHWFERIGMKAYSYILPYSDIDAGKARRLNPTIQYEMVPQGVTEEYFKIVRKHPQHILYLGRLDISQKGIDLLLLAYKKIVDRSPYPLIIAGHGPDEVKIRAFIRKLGLEDKVQLVGSAYGQKKMDLISEAACVVFPSRHDEMCLWTLEALASGMPHVIFDLPESAWIPNSVALKCHPFDVEAFAINMLKVLEPRLNRSMGLNAREFARLYSWDNVVEKFETFTYKVLSIEKSKYEK